MTFSARAGTFAKNWAISNFSEVVFEKILTIFTLVTKSYLIITGLLV